MAGALAELGVELTAEAAPRGGRRLALGWAALWAAAFGAAMAFTLLPLAASIVAVAVGISLLVGLIRPVVAYYLALLTIFEEMVYVYISYGVDHTSVYYYISHVFLLASFIGWACGRATGRMAPRERTGADAILWIIVFWEAFSILWSPNWLYSLNTLSIVLLNAIIFYLTGCFLRDGASLRTFARVLTAAGVICAAGVIFSQWIDASWNGKWTLSAGYAFEFAELHDRPSGFAGPNHGAGFLSLTLMITWGRLLAEPSRRRRLVLALMMAWMVAGVIITQSRAGFVGMLGGIFAFIFIHPHYRGRQLRAFALAPVVLLLITLMAAPGFIDRMLIGFGYQGELLFSSGGHTYYRASATAGAKSPSGMAMRMYWWKCALNEMGDHPWKILSGLGMGSFTIYSKGSVNSGASPEVNTIYLALFYDLGLVGLLLAMALGVVLVAHALKSYRLGWASWLPGRTLEAASIYNGILGGVVAMVGVQGIVEYDFTSLGSKLMWLCFALVMSGGLVAQREVEVGRADR